MGYVYLSPSRSAGETDVEADSKTLIRPPQPSCCSCDRTNFRERAMIFLKLALPGAAMFGFEAWTFELQTVLSGLLGTVSLDAHAIMLNIGALSWLAGPCAIGIA